MFFSPSIEQCRAQGREEHTLWAVRFEEYRIVQVSAFDCGPDNPDTYWCPEVGYSLTMGANLFSTQREATDVALRQIDNEIHKLRTWRSEID